MKYFLIAHIMQKNKTLVLGAGRKTRGGITSVINAHSQGSFWKEFNCLWIETYIDRGSTSKVFYFIKGLFQFIFNLPGSKLVHIHLSGPTSTFRKSIFFKIAKLFRKKVILHFHAFSAEETLFGTKKMMYKNMFEKADAIITLSDFWKNQSAKIIDNHNKIYVVFNPCDSTIQLRKDIKKYNEIIYAGSIIQRKGYADLIIAFSKIAHKYPEWSIVFAGNGEIDKGIAISKKYKIENKVVFKGWVSDKEKEEVFSRASIFCLPSYSEGFPMAILDAWAYGLPVITTPVGGLPDVLINGANAMVFQPGDTASLANNLEQLINDEFLRNKLSESSIKLKDGQFNINTISNQLSDIYKGLLVCK
jgi:glycosyltransferase involved in cell wall biosynthesis